MTFQISGGFVTFCGFRPIPWLFSDLKDKHAKLPTNTINTFRPCSHWNGHHMFFGLNQKNVMFL